MFKSWSYLKLTTAALIVGGFAGWVIRGKPPQPEVIVKYREAESSKLDEQKQGTTSTSSSIFVVSPASVSNRKIKRYHPPSPIVTCPGPGEPCICPGPALAEEEEITTNTGPGTTSTNTQTNSTFNEQKQAEHKSSKSGESHTRPVEKNWHASFLPGLSLVDPLVDIPGASRVVVGGNVERRIFSLGGVDVSVGIWASSVGAGGPSLGVDW